MGKAFWQNKHKLFFMATLMLAVGYVLLSKSSKQASSNKLLTKDEDETPSYVKMSSCKQNNNVSIFYIKIQKTGSSTIKSMLLNYGLKKKMKICMDNTDLHHMNFPYQIDESKLVKKPNEKCQLVADELIFHEKQASSMMFGRPLIITSLRDPIMHFVSMYKFTLVHYAVEMLTLLKLDFWDGVRVFLKNPDLVRAVYNTFDRDEMHDFLLQQLVRPNLQSFSLGLNADSTEKEIKSKINSIE
ncbi:galactosylceramide sulfotransferase-like [Clytia hemisphaerica]|uniref:Uncharacterized protein n=1 Tax=Clytia hemisphaerica TaxID=252671 RepID=A0A7M5X5J3_9CNID